MITTPHVHYQITDMKNNDTVPEYYWNIKATCVVVSIILLSFFTPLAVGRLGLSLSVLCAPIGIIYIIGSVLRLNLSWTHKIGLYLLAIIFLNIDFISLVKHTKGDITQMEVESTRGLSWILAALFILYCSFNLRAILHCIQTNRFVRLILFFFALMLVSFLLNNPFSVFFNFFTEYVFYLMIILVTAEIIISSPHAGLALLYTITLCGIVPAISSILEYLYPFSLGMSHTLRNTLGERIRTSSLYSNPNAMAYAISFSAIVMTWLSSMKRISLKLCFVLLGIFAVSIFFTFSRRGALTLALAFLGFAVAFIRRYKNDPHTLDPDRHIDCNHSYRRLTDFKPAGRKSNSQEQSANTLSIHNRYVEFRFYEYV